jgi:ribosomal protein S18 acetylase RimI-like enzyme
MRHIRPFRTEDEAALVALWTAADLVQPWNDPRKDIARKLAVQPELFLVATEDDTLVGTVMAGYDGHRGWINYLAVYPAQRKLGLGRALMEEAERLLAALGCVKVNIQIRRDNLDATAFYTRLGYSEDAVVSMGKRLVRDDV